MFESCPVLPGSWRRRAWGAVWVQTIALVGVLVLLMGGVGYWVLAGSTEDLLDAETLTPKQIYQVATKLLLHNDLEIRAKASAKLTSLGRQAVGVLKEIGLTHSDAKLRFVLFGILRPMDGDAALEVLENLFNHADPEVRKLALDAASGLNHPRAEAILVRALDDPDAGVRSVAAGQAGPANARSAIPKLKRLLDDPKRSIQRHAARSLETLTGVDYSDRIKRRRR